MSASTNPLVAKAKKLGAPAGAIAAVLLAIAFLVGHNVHAASVEAVASNGAAPLDDSSVSSLVALDNAVEAVAARVTPAVVNVSVTARASAEKTDDDDQGPGGIPPGAIPPEFRKFFGNGGRGRGLMPPSAQVERGIGSGIIISPDGYIVTNNHVAGEATQIRVTLNDRRVFPAKLVGVDKLNDLAVIKIDAKNLTAVAWGDSTKLHPGQTVLAFGSPFGYFQF